MAAKKKAAKAGKGAVAAGRAASSNEYLQRLVDDEDLRDNLRSAFESTRKVVDRINGKGPAKAIMDDKKTQKEIKEAANSLRDVAETLRGAKRKRKRGRRGGLLLLVLVGAGAAVGLNEGLRKKALDAVFGSEEQFEYSSTTGGNSHVPAGSAGAPPSEPAPPPPAATSPGSPPGAPPSGPAGT